MTTRKIDEIRRQAAAEQLARIVLDTEYPKLTRNDLKRMSAHEIVEAKAAGLLDHLLGGEAS